MTLNEAIEEMREYAEMGHGESVLYMVPPWTDDTGDEQAEEIEEIAPSADGQRMEIR